MPDSPNTVEPSSRHVIEHRLLTALEEDPTAVALLASKDDLDILIQALCYVPLGADRDRQKRINHWLESMKQLRQEAFGE